MILYKRRLIFPLSVSYDASSHGTYGYHLMIISQKLVKVFNSYKALCKLRYVRKFRASYR